MLRDFIAWLEPGNQRITVSDHENERYFTRPLTFLEKSYMISNGLMEKTLTPEQKEIEVAKFKDYVEKWIPVKKKN